MQFFVPKTYNPQEAGEVRDAVRAFLDSQGLHTEERRIWKLSLSPRGATQVLRVGAAHPEVNEDIILIFKARDEDAYLVCTPSRGVVGGAPIRVPADSGRVLAVEFR